MDRTDVLPDSSDTICAPIEDGGGIKINTHKKQQQQKAPYIELYEILYHFLSSFSREDFEDES